MNLADARLRQSEYFGDFGETHVFEIIHCEDLLRYIGQFTDSCSQKLQQFLLFDLLAARHIGLVRQKLVQGSPFRVFAIIGLIYRDERNPNDTSSSGDNTIHLSIAKHRNGPLRNIDLFFDSERATFKTIEKRYDELPAL